MNRIEKYSLRILIYLENSFRKKKKQIVQFYISLFCVKIDFQGVAGV